MASLLITVYSRTMKKAPTYVKIWKNNIFQFKNVHVIQGQDYPLITLWTLM